MAWLVQCGESFMPNRWFDIIDTGLITDLDILYRTGIYKKLRRSSKAEDKQARVPNVIAY